MPRVDLVVAIHSFQCECEGTGYLPRKGPDGKRLVCRPKDEVLVDYLVWNRLGRPSTLEKYKRMVA